MIVTNPLATVAPFATPAAATSSTSSTKSTTDLGPNAFITLLTAQLQAQNPLNPLDPNQMVSELTSMNTLQETIQIRQDLDTLAAAKTPGTTAPAAASIFAPAGTVAASSAPNALAAGLAALTKSLTPAPAAVFSAPVPVSPKNSKSQLF